MLSASRRDYLIEQVRARGLEDYFTELLGLQDIYGVSKVQVGKDWLRNSGVDPAACVMVGDTTHDAEVAAAMGTKCVLCTSGHQSRARLEAVCAGNPLKNRRQKPTASALCKEYGRCFILEKMRQRDADGNDFTESSFKTPEKQGSWI